jgi:hypothetical protein
MLNNVTLNIKYSLARFYITLFREEINVREIQDDLLCKAVASRDTR